MYGGHDILEMGAEQMRLGSKIPPGHNTYRPQAPSYLQRPDDIVPIRSRLYAPSRVPCLNSSPYSNISNVYLNHGYGTYLSETKEQFDRPTAQPYGECYYELPSGYSTKGGDGVYQALHMKPTWLCDRDPVTLPPTRHDPWSLINLQHEQLLYNGCYQTGPKKRVDYRGGTICGPTSFQPHPGYY